MPQGSNEMIQLELSSNANEVVARLGRLHPLISQAIIKALNLSALVVKTQAKMLAPTRTGNLRASIGSRVEGLRQEAFVGSPVEYAGYVHDGTRPHPIYPSAKKALFWKGAAHPVKFVRHPGTKAQPYLKDALHNNVDNIRDFFIREINLAIERV